MPGTFPVLLDSMAYRRKPDSRATAAITNRLKSHGPANLTPAQFCDALRHGVTWCGGCYAPNAGSGWGRFLGQRIFALDFDNGAHDSPLHEGDEGYLGPLGALRRLDGMGVDPLALYFTFSATPRHLRYRLVVDAGFTSETEDEAREVGGYLLEQFPEADRACSNPSRLFFGSRGEVWELFRPCYRCAVPLTCPGCWVAASGNRW